ncbi:MAG: response regulator [Treponema sp.]|nr:response regulator [Treponema sp.]
MAQSSQKLLDELNRLITALAAGDSSFSLNDSGLSGNEADSLRMLTEAISKKQTAYEYDIMNLQLANKALNIALWRVDILTPVLKNIEDIGVNIWTWSQEFRTMLGFSDENDFPDTFESFYNVIHPGDIESAFTAFAAHYNDRTGKTQYDIEYRLRHKNGEYRYFDGFGTALRNDEGIPIRISGAIRDITEKKMMELEIAAANELYDAVTEASPISYVLFDENLQVVDCNEVILRLLGCNDKQYFLDHYWDTFVPKNQPGGDDSYEKATAKRDDAFSEDQARFEWVHQTVNGELIPMENTLTRVMHRGKKFIISFKYDIRRIKELNENIRSQSELLKEALEKATMASKAKSNFLSNMSHEMRTPLNAIIGMTAIGKETTALQRKNYAFNKIENASTHLLGVINDILDMSKIEANKFELSLTEFYFEKVIQRIVDVISFRAEEKHQKLTVTIDPAIPEILIGDDQRIAQVIANLMGNAVKFTPEKGSVCLEARLLEEKNDLYTIQVSVTDTGIGIRADLHEHLFRFFEQVENNTARKYGGTGLGLAISKSIVELMGGTIWVESELGKGSAFFFSIQLKRGNVKKHGQLASTVNWDNVRIMVIDDDPGVLIHFRSIIQRIGATCDTAASGEEALKLIDKNGAYNIYFVDWTMPGIDGIALTAGLKAGKSGSLNTVAIMISATEWERIEEDAKKAGVDKFLPKPLFASAIIDIINECLGVGKMNEEEAQPDNTFAGSRILLAEDIEINREIVLTLLEPMLLKIDCAKNGTEAVRMFCESPQGYDLIFMDLQMPEMDGLEAARRIRAKEAELHSSNTDKQKIPIIAMTANVFREDIEKCLEAGMDDHLGKPLAMDKVLEKLHLYLHKK